MRHVHGIAMLVLCSKVQGQVLPKTQILEENILILQAAKANFTLFNPCTLLHHFHLASTELQGPREAPLSFPPSRRFFDLCPQPAVSR